MMRLTIVAESAAFIPCIRRWMLKREIPELVFRDARRVQNLRTRCRELGANFSGGHLSNAVTGRELLETLCQAPNAEETVRAALAWLRELLHGIFATIATNGSAVSAHYTGQRSEPGYAAAARECEAMLRAQAIPSAWHSSKRDT